MNTTSGSGDACDKPVSRGATVTETKSSQGSSSNPSLVSSVNGVPIALDLENVSLVGRDDEIKILVQAYERIRKRNAPAEVCLVRGESGSGKSVLVENLRRVEKKGREFFVMGKYNQYDQDRPYGGFVEATAELSFSVSEIDDTVKHVVKESLTSEEIQLLLSIMPSINLFLPLTLTNEPLETNEQSFNRFMEVYRKFLRCICSEEHPLVLFLDDLQWVDDVSRQLIDSIAKDSKMRNFLLIGAVRQDPSVSGVYDLTCESVLYSSEIVVGALSKQDINIIVSRATLRPPSETENLSAVVYHKTGGNPYFAIQYLDMLLREELLSFSFSSNRWEWDVANINSLTNVSENVMQILVRKIESLKMDVQVALIVAAYLGFSFSIDVVECILESTDFLKSIPNFLKDKFWPLPMSKTDTHKAMAEAARSGLVDVLPEKKFKFSHDRVQQSVLSTLHEYEERQCVQTALGTILLGMSQREDSEDWMLFAAVDLLLDSNKVPAVDIEFSKTCLQAANMASNKAAFRSAAKYADAGISRLDLDDTDEERYDLWLELSNLSAEMHFSRGDFVDSNRLVGSILQRSRTVDDCYRANRVSMNTYTSLEDWGAAVECGICILNDLGVPTLRNPSKLNILATLMKSKWLLKGRKPRDLEDLLPMDNPRMAEALFFLGSTAFCSWMKGDENRCTFLCLKMFILTIEYGICTDSPYAFAAYGMCMSHIGEYTLAYEYGRLAVKTLERPGTEKAIAKTMVVVHSYLNYLRKPIQESLEPFLYGFTSGMRHGDVVQAGYCLRARACIGVVAGIRLTEHERELLGFNEFYKEFKQQATMAMQAPWLQLSQNLLGKAENVLVLTGDAMDEEETLNQLKPSAATRFDRNPSLAFRFYNVHYAKRTLLYTFGEFEMADDNRKQTARLGGETATLHSKLYDFVFCCLICLAMARKGKRVRYYKQQANVYRKELMVRAQQGCVNCVPLLALISAEKRALKDKSGDAALYKRAIAMLGRSGFRLFKAIACERAGEYMLECNDSQGSHEYLQQAWDEFNDYGALAKLFQMREKYCGIYTFSECFRLESRSSSKLKAHHLEKWNQDVR